MAAKLLTMMVLIPFICEGALLEKSRAYDFLQKIRERRGLECFPGGCSTEVREAGELVERSTNELSKTSTEVKEKHMSLDTNWTNDEESPSLLYNGAVAKKEINFKPAREAVVDDGSGM